MPFHAHVERSHADGLRGIAGVERRLRRGERRPFARPLEPDAARARPGDYVAFRIGDRHHGVVERRLDMRQPMMDDALLASLLECLLAPSGRAFFFLRCRAFGCRRRFALRHLDHLLLRDGALARAFARSGVRSRTLAAHRQAPAVARATVAADFHEPLDVHRDLFAQIPLDAALLIDDAADLAHVVLRQILDPHIGTDARLLQDAVRAYAPDPEDVGQPDFHALRAGKINACYTRHAVRPWF